MEKCGFEKLLLNNKNKLFLVYLFTNPAATKLSRCNTKLMSYVFSTFFQFVCTKLYNIYVNCIKNLENKHF